LTKYDDGMCAIEFPDWGTATEGESVEEALRMGLDLLRGDVTYALASGRPLPEATFEHELEDGDERVILGVWTSEKDALKEWPWLTTVQAAEALGVTVGRVHHLITDGKLASTKEGRDVFVSREDVEARLKAPRRAGRPKKRELVA
jgi:excisionase family DNA binding protein